MYHPLVFWILVALALTSADSEEGKKESEICANDSIPWCAKSPTGFQLFKNECHLRRAQNENQLDVVALHQCLPNCDFNCGDSSSDPICGINTKTKEKKTFSSSCEMIRSSCSTKRNWVLIKKGICPKEEPVPCTTIYRPVCAIYIGVKSTFSNECLVHAENIKANSNWKIISEGVCGEDSAKMKHKYKPKAETKEEPVNRTKRNQNNLLEDNNADADDEIPEDAVEIFAPSTFHTQFISNRGTIEKSYSIPARKPDMIHKSVSNSVKNSKPCVFTGGPVCGSFKGEKRTFSNVCSLIEYNRKVGKAWKVLHEGSCRRCDFACTSHYQPICAKRNGINYTIVNECHLQRIRCNEIKTNWQISHLGECPQPSIESAEQNPNNHKPPTGKPNQSKYLGNLRKAVLQTPSIEDDLSNRKIRKTDNTAIPTPVSKYQKRTNSIMDQRLRKTVQPSPMRISTTTTLPATSINLPTTTIQSTASSTQLNIEGTTVDDQTTDAPRQSRKISDSIDNTDNILTSSTTFVVAPSTTPATITEISSSEEETTETTDLSAETTVTEAATTTATLSPIAQIVAAQTTTLPTESAVVTELSDNDSSINSSSQSDEITTESSISSSSSSSSSSTVSTDNYETPQDSSQHTSIYGLGENSMIMRLLRAKSKDTNIQTE